MAKYATLKAAVEAAIRTNGQQQITGQVLQTQLVNMITSLGKYFQSFGGLATPAGSFSAGDESVTFLAVEAGTYTNFGGAVLDGKTLHVLAYDGDWADVDTLIPSGAAFEAALALAIKGAQSGIAEGIADTISAGTAQEFLQRQSGGDGVNCIKRIKGVTKAINQLADGKMSSSSQGLTIDYADGVFTINGTATNSWVPNVIKCNTINGRKYLISSTIISGSGSGSLYNGNGVATAVPIGSSGIYEPTGNGTYLGFATYSGAVFSQLKMKVTVTDLTLAGFADYTLAQILALYPNGFGANNAGVLKSNDAAALLTDGRNQWDEVWEGGAYNANTGAKISGPSMIRSKNYIPCLPNTEYFFAWAGKAYNDAVVLFYDANNNFIDKVAGKVNDTFTTPSGAAFLTWYGVGTSYKNDICINLSDASFNGTYQPYWQRVLALRLTELTGIPEGGTEADRVTMFPNGLGGAGSAFDSLFVENGVTKARRTMALKIDLGGLSSWGYGEYGGVNYFQCPVSGLKAAAPTSVANLICTRYTPRAAATSTGSGNGIATIDSGGTTYIRIYDSSMGSADIVDGVIAKLSGVELLAEAATPIVYTDLQYADGTPFTMPATILVDNYGTERIQAPEGATTPSAPFCCDSNYSIGVANLVKRLAALENAE